MIAQDTIIRISSASKVNNVAGTIAHTIRANGFARLQTIGAGAANQAIKAVAIARSFLSRDGLDVSIYPDFVSVTNADGSEISALRMFISAQSMTETPELARLNPERVSREMEFVDERSWEVVP